MVNKLLNSRLSAVIPDPTLSFITWISSVWTQSTGYTVPALASVKIGRKFGEFKGFFNYIVVEEMPKRIEPQVLGNGRYTNNEVKRIQVLCIGKTAQVTKWNIERHIESLINGNPTAMQATYGLDNIGLTDFNEIPTSETEDVKTGLQPNTGFQKARSSALVTMRWESEITSI